MSEALSPIPDTADVIGEAKKISGDWYRWLYEVWLRIRANVALVSGASVSNQSASIATTTAWSVIQTGVYRVSYALRITTADGVSSSATVTISWREGSVTLAQAGAAVTGDTTTTQQNGTLTVRADSGTNISYAVLYASNTPAKMRFKCDVTVEIVN